MIDLVAVFCLLGVIEIVLSHSDAMKKCLFLMVVDLVAVRIISARGN